MANEKTPVVWDDTTKKHRPLGTGEKMGGLDASSLLSSDSGNLLEAGSDGLAYLSGSGMVDPRADNLLEDSANGKLQVTIDRIAEWLDGHPQDAAALADAINVVSGDSGNVIVEGTDKGAFLSKGAISAAVAGMTDAQKNQLADAISARIASDIADGKTIVASNGKLTSDPTNATAAQKKAINQALADADSGLVVDSSTGRLKVDFSQMPTDKFEELLSSLNIQIPLTANLDLIVDVDNPNAGDSIVDGRGTASKPFKTIGACALYAANTYALGSHSIHIRVKAGTYVESVTLPKTNSGTGSIHVEAYDFSTPPILQNARQYGSVVSVTGGNWTLRRLTFVCSYSATGSSSPLPASNILSASGGAICGIYGCHFSMTYTGEADIVVRGLRIFSCSTNSFVQLLGMATYFNVFELHKGNANSAYFFYMERGAELVLSSSNDSTIVTTFPCTGECSVFARASIQARISIGYSGAYKYTFVDNSVTGIKYNIGEGSGVYAPLGGFPGTDDTGIVETSTYSWYKEYTA